MCEYTCAKCNKEFEAVFSFGSDIKCEECGTWNETEFEYITTDSLACWVTGIAKESE